MRLQLQRPDLHPGQAPLYTGMLNAFSTITRQEGLYALWKVRCYRMPQTQRQTYFLSRDTLLLLSAQHASPAPLAPCSPARPAHHAARVQGLEAGLQKQVLYTGLRLSLYDELATYTEGEVPIYMKIMYATATTGLGILVANPADVVQTKFIAHRTKPAAEIQAELRSAAASTPPAPAGPQVAASRQASARPGVAQHTSSSSGSVRGFHTHAAAALDQLQRGGNPRLRGSSAHSSLLRHVYGHHLRWHGGVAAAALRGAQGGGLAHAACPSSTHAPRPTFWRALRGARGFSDDAKRSVGAAERPAGAAAEALAQGANRGPKTVTGVPLQNARMAYYIIVREEGLVNGLYRGFWANFACSCVQGASEIATYDVAKTAALAAGYPDSVPVHLAAGANLALRRSSALNSQEQALGSSSTVL